MTRRERLKHLTPSDAVRGLEAAVLFPVVSFALHRWGLRHVQERLARWVRHPRSRRRLGFDDAQRLAWVVDVAGRRGLWQPNCLQRSVVLWWLLARRGSTAELRIGVRRKPGTPSGSRLLDFHAWVERDGVVLNDSPSVREQFATFGRPIAPADARWR